MMATPKSQSKRDAAVESLLKRDPSLNVEPGAAVPWVTLPSKEELLAALRPLPGSTARDADAPADNIAHNPTPAADKRGAFVERGGSGKSRLNRSGHKP